MVPWAVFVALRRAAWRTEPRPGEPRS
jgi:hypothetical protein